MSSPNTAPTKIGWLAALNPRYLADPSTLFLIAANLLPLVGVMFWGWDLYSLMVLYWMETGIIGFFAIIQMGMAVGLTAIVLVPFFIVHFGGFMAGHILFITALFASGGLNRIEDIPAMIWSLVVDHGLWLAFVALFISHLVSFVLNVQRPRREEQRLGVRHAGVLAQSSMPNDAQSYMLAPYGRVVLMHVTIIFGAMLAQLLRTNVAAFALLIALKIVFDVAAHVRKNFSPVALTTR